MKMTDILEKDKENLITEITGAGTAEKAVRVLENETDKLLIRYNEQCDSENERDAAAYMMQAVRLALPLIDSAGRTKVWERGGDKADKGDRKGKAGIPFILLTIAAIALIAYGLAPLVTVSVANAGKEGSMDLLMRSLFVIGGAVMAFFAGALSRSKTGGTGKKEHQVEIHVDASKIYRHYRTAVLSVEQSLEEIKAKERWDKREQAGNIDGRQAMTPEIELFSDLIAASYSGDPEYALEKLDEIKYYLHRQQIDVIDYSKETAQYFDMMPGAKGGTIRPALVADGALLKKGLASTGK